MTEARQSYRLVATSFEALPGWATDDPSPVWPALTDCLRQINDIKPYRTGSLGLTADDLRPLLTAATAQVPASASDARQFFETHCVPFRIQLEGDSTGLVTAFYEPEVLVSDQSTPEFVYPFYRRPDDLIDIDDTNRPSGFDPAYAFARQSGSTIDLYPDRQAIDSGYLNGKGLEIAWAKSKVDVFFAHVQGAARLKYSNGQIKRITYAAKAGHPFSAIGRKLIDLGEIGEAAISMQSIREWLSAHPERVDEILWHNRSYIFFREAEVTDLTRGPIAAAKVPLIAGRSLAVDRAIHTFGFPFFIASESLRRLDEGTSFGRLMLALDTGSAIVGPARGDIFTGSGDEAGDFAGAVRNAAHFYILCPKAAAERFR